MFKINRGYHSFFDAIKYSYGFGRWINRKIYHVYNDYREHEILPGRMPPLTFQPYNWQITGAFQPLADMAKNFVKTFKPYKSFQDFYDDLLQPFHGISNTFKGVGILVFTPFVFMDLEVRNLKYLVNPFQFDPFEFFKSTARLSYYSLSWLIEGAAKVIRGTTQILATPILTWPCKIILNVYLTRKYEAPAIQQNAGVKEAYAIGRNLIANEAYHASLNPDHFLTTCAYLHNRFCKAITNVQRTNIPPAIEESLYKALPDIDDYDPRAQKAISNYIDLFSTDPRTRYLAIQSEPYQQRRP